MWLYKFTFPPIVCLVVVQLLSRVRFFATPRTAACQAPLSFTTSWSFLRFMSLESVMLSKHLILCHLLFLLSSNFPSSKVFSAKSALCIRWPKYWSFSPSNEYSLLISFRIDWFDLLAVQGLSRVFSNTTVQSINSLVLSLYGPTLTSVHDYWKNHSFARTDLCQQSDVSAV